MSKVLRSARVGDSPFAVEPRVNAAEDAERRLENAEERARRLLAEARATAERIRKEAEAEATGRRATLESEVARALAEGRARGGDEGRAQAREEVVREARGALAQIRRMAEALYAERERAWREQEAEIVDMAVRVAEKIICAQAAVDREMIVRTVREAIARATEKDRLLVRVHPDDLVVLENYVGSLRDEFRSLGQVEIEEDRRISRGGCVVESRSGYIDATLESQLHQVRRELGLME